MKEIILTRGFKCQVSDEDYTFLSNFTWCEDQGYARRSQRIDGKTATIYLHQIVAERMGLIGQIDHEDRNGLNNQRTNLRCSTQSQNIANTDIRTNNRSGYKGVSWHKSNSKWLAKLMYQKRTIHLGYFDCPIQAAKAYNIAAVRYFGKFAYLNIVT